MPPRPMKDKMRMLLAKKLNRKLPKIMDGAVEKFKELQLGPDTLVLREPEISSRTGARQWVSIELDDLIDVLDLEGRLGVNGNPTAQDLFDGDPNNDKGLKDDLTRIWQEIQNE